MDYAVRLFVDNLTCPFCTKRPIFVGGLSGLCLRVPKKFGIYPVIVLQMSQAVPMELTLCDITALDYWRRASTPSLYGLFSSSVSFVPADMLDQAWPSRRRPLPSMAPDCDAIESLMRLGVIEDGHDVHVLVGDMDSRRRLRGVVCHLNSRPLPAGCLFPAVCRGEVIDGLSVCSPELAFLQALSRLTRAEALQLGLELCGTFRRANGEVVYGCEPITSAHAIRRFAALFDGFRNVKALRSVARYVANGSGSPAEAAIYCSLILPARYGGSGFEMPILNHEISLNTEAATLLGRETITPDIYWDGVAFEYDSLTFHSLQEQQEYDERRRNAYAAMGIPVVVGRPRHLRSVVRFEAITGALRRNLDKRVYRLPSDYESKRAHLLSELFGYWMHRNEWSDPLTHF